MSAHLVRVRHHGPTTYRGARMRAQLVGVEGAPAISASRDYARDASEQARDLALTAAGYGCGMRHEVSLAVQHASDTYYVIRCAREA